MTPSLISRLSKSALCIVALSLAGTSIAATKEEERVAAAAQVVHELLRIPERSIPPSLLSSAYAIAVIPDVVKVGFVLGVRHGKGILAVRRPDNTWSNPSFIKMTGGSVGFQAGAQRTDVILVFKTPSGVEDITNGKLTLGADAAVAAGPVGRQTGVATDLSFEAEVLSYSRSRGLFAGVALDGANISIDRASNAAFYGSSRALADDIFAADDAPVPTVAANLVRMLAGETERMPNQPDVSPGAQSGASEAPAGFEEPDAERKVRTFGISSPEDAEALDETAMQDGEEQQ